MKKESPGAIDPGAFYDFAAEPDGQPVGGVKSAAPGYHYTLGPPPFLWSHLGGRVGTGHRPASFWSVVPRSHDPLAEV